MARFQGKADGAAKWAPGPAGLYRQVWTAAGQFALAEHRGLEPDDLRHGCHVVALGRDKSSKDLTNAECDRVVCLFRVLTEPDDIDALIEWEDPKVGELKRLKWRIEHAAPDGYVRAIAADRFGTRLWEDLEEEQLRQLALTLRERTRRFRKPVNHEWTQRDTNEGKVLTEGNEGNPF